MPRPGAARLVTLLIVITAAEWDAGGCRPTVASTTSRRYGRGGLGGAQPCYSIRWQTRHRHVDAAKSSPSWT